MFVNTCSCDVGDDMVIATLKAACTMIPSGAAREILLEALQQVGKNPEQLIALAGAFGKMAGKDDLMKIITSNPEVFKAYLNGGAEAAENLLKYEDEIIQAGKSLSGDELIALLDGGKAPLHSADEVVEAGAKVVVSSGDEVVETGVKVVTKSGDEIAEAGTKIVVNSSEVAVEAGARAVANSGNEVAGSGGSVIANTSNEAADIISDGSHLVTDNKGKVVGLEPNVTYKTGEFDYLYKTDDMGRLNSFETDNLQLTTRDTRLTHNSNTPGKGATGVTDHAGHIAGDRFGGSPELDNLVSQAQNVNLSEYKVIENKWANAIENGQKVSVDIKINYDPGSMRPTSFDVSYTIDDVPFFQSIKN